MRRPLLLLLLIALAQLAVPAWMVWRHERVRLHGHEHRFRTGPIDPRDPLRGEYVVLDFEAATGHFELPPEWAEGTLYAALGTDSAGFATIERLSTETPDGDHLAVRVEPWTVNSEDRTASRVTLPFDRYYVEEGSGPQAEALLRPDRMDDGSVEPRPAHAVVRVLDGRAVLVDLVIDGRPLTDWLNDPTPR
ncbi:MAG: GDYXXLXY domain-containing protein [Flavobacteriales bacterium]|nr:hypothetical protein [Flavobacteriales bacterium]MCC6578243.1 GDYXXLXY domain-containing protein [Flavobacteriales bacterium]NUQ16557.1 GDYXXLXY domain-containing protein [Flavobacteriales bacterium]